MEEQKENNLGAPSKYNDKYAEQAYKLCLLGATDKDLADFFECCEATINNWKIANPNFLESIHAGKKVADMEVAHSLYKTTQDRVVIEQTPFKTKNVFYNEEGKRIEVEKIEIVETEKVIPADFRGQQFWLNNRNPERWRTKQEVDHTTGGHEMSIISLGTGIDPSKSIAENT